MRNTDIRARFTPTASPERYPVPDILLSDVRLYLQRAAEAAARGNIGTARLNRDFARTRVINQPWLAWRQVLTADELATLGLEEHR